MKIKKVLFLAISVMIACVSVFAYEGKMAGEKNIKSAKTKYFDIVYPESCKESAAILFENADKIYEDMAARYKWDPYLYVVVTITSEVQTNQSYFDGMPWNHIVICDTAQRDDYIAYQDAIINQFTHEMTHAFTRCIRAPMWKLFGFDLGFVFYNTAFTDGAAIVEESINGDGRLSDEYFKHIVKQAKIENDFPRIWDLQGENPEKENSTAEYNNFWAMFTEYLQNEYGMESYRKYWYQMVNWLSITMRQGFRKAYKKQGKKLEPTWQEWQNSLDYSNVEANIFDEKYGITDFFTDEGSFSDKNKTGMRFSDLQKTEKGFYFLNIDKGVIYFVSKENLGTGKIERLCSYKDITKISSSKDGRFIAVSYDSVTESNLKAKVAIFDTETKKWFKIKDDGLFETTIVQKDSSYYIVSTKYEKHLYSTEISEFVLNDGTISDFTKIAKIPYALNNFPVTYADNDGKIAFILKNKDGFSICTSNLDGTIEAKYNCPKEKMFIKQLSAENDCLYFSYTVPKSMPRLGRFDLATERFILDSEDFSGGVFFPVALDKEKVAYISVFHRENAILERSLSNIENSSEKIACSKSANFSIISQDSSEISTDTLLQNSKPYNFVEYLGRPVGAPIVGVPISIAYSRDYIDGSDCFYWQPIGISFFSADPWKDGHFRLHMGYGVETNSISAHFAYISDPDTENYYYQVKSASEIDFNRGWKLSNLGGNFSYSFAENDGNTVKVGASGFANLGHRNKKNYDLATLGQGDGLNEIINNAWSQVQNYFLNMNVNSAYDELDSNLYLYTSDSLNFSYSFIKQIGCGKYDKAGFEIGTDFYYVYKAKTTGEWEVYDEKIDLGFDVSVFFPGFAYDLVKETKYTYNAPARFIFSLFPYDVALATGSDSIFFNSATESMNKLAGENLSSDIIFVGYGEIVLFGMDISRAIPGIELLSVTDFKVSFTLYDFIFDATKSGGYFKVAKTADYFNGNIQTNQWVYCGLRTDLGLNITMGTFAGASIGNIFFEGMFNVYGEDAGFRMAMGFAMDF